MSQCSHIICKYLVNTWFAIISIATKLTKLFQNDKFNDDIGYEQNL